MRPLTELSLLSRTIYIIDANMAVTLAQCRLFFQTKGKWIKRGKNHYKLQLSKQRVHCFSKRSLLRRHSHYDRACRLSKYIFSKSYTSAVVWKSATSLSCKIYLLKWWTSYLRLAVQFKLDQKNICLFPLTTVYIFTKVRSHEVHWKVHDLAALSDTVRSVNSTLNS